jgi:plasmid stability protein
MLGLGLLVRLGRQVLAGPVADAGVLPAGYYRHLILTALEEEDFPSALHYLKWAENPLLAQIIVLRLRLLAARHRRQVEAVEELMGSELSAEHWERCQALLTQEGRALELLKEYEGQALALLSSSRKHGGREEPLNFSSDISIP